MASRALEITGIGASGAVDIVVVDSVAALVPNQNEGEMGPLM